MAAAGAAQMVPATPGSARDVVASIPYFARNPPPEVFDGNGMHTFGRSGETPAEFKAGRQKMTELHDVKMVDARGAVGGLESWTLDRNGIMVLRPPPPVDFEDAELVKREYYPAVSECVKQHTGATRCFVMSFGIRSETPPNATMSYAGFAHTDAGPGAVKGWRLVLPELGVPEAEAQNCAVCMMNLWFPRDRPAYQNPLCVLDVASLPSQDLVDNVGGHLLQTVKYQPGHGGINLLHKDLPVAKPKEIHEDGRRSKTPYYALGPLYEPTDRWVFISDQTPEEAWLFKQYDERNGVAKSVCHTAFRDPTHQEKPKTTHGRRSVEFRLLLTFPKRDGPTSSSKL